jgi:hypothetical protein
MIILNDQDMETIVGGQTFTEYALILGTMQNVADKNPVVQISENLNEKAFEGVFTGSIIKLIKEADALEGELVSNVVQLIHNT